MCRVYKHCMKTAKLYMVLVKGFCATPAEQSTQISSCQAPTSDEQAKVMAREAGV